MKNFTKWLEDHETLINIIGAPVIMFLMWWPIFVAFGWLPW